ncbi:uncharacterized protein LOC127255017 [Andrographis paniculata]|uniref:uncharacterized protein LOC127255017 n=1 Tax=Andrographis paniculata TaxID=175694 RepID=UPI0021E9933F|nr:uncharacterized protein LOC127255017 [Andrographis paniculata]
MGKSNGRDWTQIYAIYGVDEWQTPAFLLVHAVVFSVLALAFLLYFEPICLLLHRLLPPAAARFAAGFTGSVTAISAVCLFFAGANFLYSAVALHWEMSQRIVSSVPDWSSVKHALDLGCGRGILLNAVALQLKKSGSSGRVVGLAPTHIHSLNPTRTLQTAALEGVQEYVTCRGGDPTKLPFSDSYFDVVVSAVFVHKVGKEYGSKSAAAAAERMRVLGEVVRVLKPGGAAVVWDVVHAPEYVQRLSELRMEEIRVSERVTAFMVSSQIVSFRKPRQHIVGPGEVRLDWSWRFNHLG